MRERPSHKSHLHFVVSYPEDDGGWALIVGVTSKAKWQTADFVLHAGDHPAIKSDCVLSYASLNAANMEKLARGYREFPKLMWAERKASPGLIKKVQQALLDSGRLEARFVDLIDKAHERDKN